MKQSLDIDIERKSIKEEREEQTKVLARCLAVNAFWFVPAVAFVNYLIAFALT